MQLLSNSKIFPKGTAANSKNYAAASTFFGLLDKTVSPKNSLARFLVTMTREFEPKLGSLQLAFFFSLLRPA
jgi:hypothetical protein